MGDGRGADAGMGGAGSDGAAPRRYDLGELRRCLALACTPGELADVAARLAVGPLAPVRGTGPTSADETARQLLRALDQQGRVEELVVWLREHHPLVEWPAPLAPAPQASAALPPATTALAPAEALLEIDAVPEPSRAPAAAERAAGAPPRPQPIRLDPTAESDDERPAAAAARSAGGRPPWMLAAGAAAVLLVGVALAVGFAAGRGTQPSATATSAPETVAQQASGSIAAMAAQALAQAVTSAAESCGLEDTQGAARDVLVRVFRRCGSARSLAVSPAGRPTAVAPAPSETATAAPHAPGGHERPDRPQPGTGASGCLQRCNAEHQQCRSAECGAEPTDASRYEDYQKCLTRCLGRASQCKLRCG